MRECKIYITTTDADSCGKVYTAASGEARDIIAALSDALVCMAEQTKKDDVAVERVVYRAVSVALEQHDQAKITSIVQVKPDAEATL